jgi:hypothetical protein
MMAIDADLLGSAAQVIIVGDRESDIYAQLEVAPEIWTGR